MNKSVQHIALVANTSWSIYNFRLGLIKALIAAGHQVYTIAPRDDYSDKLTAAGATYIPLKMNAHTTSASDGLKTMWRLRKIYLQYSFNIILHYTIKANIFGSIAAKLTRSRSIAIVTGLGRTFQFSGASQKVLKNLYRLGVTCSDEVWFLNKEDRQRFIAEGLVKSKKTFILPSEGINTRKFVAHPKRHVQGGITRFLFAGRLLKDKGILEFVEASKAFMQYGRKVKFEVVGFVNPDNDMSVSLDEIEHWQNQKWINYLGSHEDIRPFIRRADCIVFPSYYQEGISRILLEAASMSRPIITTDNVGCRDIVTHQYNGLLVPTRSTGSLIEAIDKFLLMDPQDWIEMGNRGRKKVIKQYGEDKIIEIYFSKLFATYTKNPPTKNKAAAKGTMM